MQGITSEENGLGYIFLCLLRYSGTCFYLVWFAVLCIYYAVKGTLYEKRAFALPGLLLLLTVFNPFFPLILNRFFDVNSEYYRFIWIAPVIPLLAYAGTSFVTRDKYKGGRAVPIFFAVAFALMASGVFMHAAGNDNSKPLAENPFKVPNEVLEVSRIIHSASDSTFPKAICDLNMEMELRQYDSTILLSASREQYLGAIYGTAFDEQTRNENLLSDRLVHVMVLNTHFPKDEFVESMEGTQTEFFVVTKNSPINDYLVRDMGLKKVGETFTRNVLKYSLQNDDTFELPDYNDVWKEQGFPWSLLNH
ncbi:MAG: hypothetical protein J6P05_07350 [Lachnospiraceae bacterium]|nr:hypothetical protein [Lachnospiraceae bacterium]